MRESSAAGIRDVGDKGSVQMWLVIPVALPEYDRRNRPGVSVSGHPRCFCSRIVIIDGKPRDDRRCAR